MLLCDSLIHVRAFKITHSTLKQTPDGAQAICIKGPGGGIMYFQHQKQVTEFINHMKKKIIA